MAGKVDDALSLAKAKLQSENKLFQCPNETINGFPFRISVTCDETSYFDNTKGFFLEAGKLQSAAQAYQPGKAVVELEGPAVLTVAHTETFDVKWNSLRASVVAGFSGLEKFSTIGKNISLVPAKAGQDSVDLDELQIHGRKVKSNDVDLALTSENVRSSNESWPDFDLVGNVRISDVHDKLTRDPDLLKLAKSRGLKGEIMQLDYASYEGGKLSVTGPVEIDTQGLITGKFQITASELKPLIQSLGRAIPEQKDLLSRAEDAAEILSSVSKNGQLKLPITVNKGKVSLGFVGIGSLGPVF